MNDKNKEEKKQDLQPMPPRMPASPFERFDFLSDSDFFREMDRFIDDYLPRRWWQQFRHGWPGRFAGHAPPPFAGKTPSVDILNRENDFLIKAELPGVDKKDINITIANNAVTIEASTDKEEKEEKDEYYRREISRGSYQRVISLPEPVKESEAQAVFRNGVLELTIPKQEKAKRSTIKVE